MYLTREQAESYSQGGSSFFKLEDGQSAKVRFLYNIIDDIRDIGVHSVNTNAGQYATIDCNRLPTDPVDNCKWCAQGNKPVSRVIIPLFNVESNTIQYWTRTSQWVNGTLIPTLEEIPQGQPISGQVFKIKRTGKDLKTTYNIMAEMGVANDGKTKDQFGDVKDPFEAGVVKPSDYEFPVATSTQGQGNFTASQSTRRTTDVF